MIRLVLIFSFIHYGKAVKSIKHYISLTRIVCESFFFSVTCHAEAKRLLHELMKDYNKNVLPVPSINQTVNVSLGLKLSQLSDIDERNQIMTTNVWLQHVRKRSVQFSYSIFLYTSTLGMDRL